MPLVFGILAILAIGLTGGWQPLVVIGSVAVMIFLHELGHFLTAKWAGMKVTEFFLGIGPKLWSFRRGETEYGIKAIPVVAYVRVVGMSNLEDVDPADEARTYRQQPYWRRMSVAVAGSTMHFLMVLLCIFLVLVFHGRPGGTSLFPTEKQFLRAEDAAATAPDWVVIVTDGGPAQKAGIRSGDHLVSFDGEQVKNFDALKDLVLPRKGDTVPVVVERDGRERTIDVKIGARDDDESKGFLGVGPSLRPVHYGVVDGAGRTFVEFGNGVVATVASVRQIFSPSGISDLADQVANPNTTSTSEEPTGSTTKPGEEAGPRQRPVSIFGAIGIGADFLREGWIGLIYFLAILNVFVGVFNLIPLLPLDGGHVAIATYERIRSRKGRRYHADVAKLLPLTYVVVLALVLLGVASLYLDILDQVTASN